MITLGDFLVAVAEAAAQYGKGSVSVEHGDWSIGIKSITAHNGSIVIELDDTGIHIDIKREDDL